MGHEPAVDAQHVTKGYMPKVAEVEETKGLDFGVSAQHCD
jgi:hypothetical protein